MDTKISQTVKLCKHSGVKCHEIFNPRWHDKRVMLAVHKTAEHNVIAFTKTKALDGLFYVSGKTARKYKKESNGTIDCYCIPLEELKNFVWEYPCRHLM